MYWIVNLIDRRIDVYSEPAGADGAADYRARTDIAETDDVPLVIDGLEVAKIAARDLLP